MAIKTKSTKSLGKGKTVTITIRGQAGVIMPAIVKISKLKGVSIKEGGACFAAPGAYRIKIS